MNYYTVVIDAFDGQQFGMLRIAVQASTEEQAQREALKQAANDGYTQLKVMFTLGG